MNWSKAVVRWASCLLATGILTTTPGCGGGEGSTPHRAPTITSQPAATPTVTEGNSVSFTVVATGTPTPTYQWKKDGTAVTSGGTDATFAIASAVGGDAGTYTVTVTNSVGTITSNPAVLSVLPRATAPTIDVQPAPNTSVLEGGSVSLSVSATTTDGGTLSYQWRQGTTNVGGNSNSITLNPVPVSGAGTYTVVVTNTLNGTSAQTTSNAAVLTVFPLGSGPTITAHPSATTPMVPDAATFTVVATSSYPLSYQWKKNGAAISGADGASYTTPATTLQELSATYTVDVTASGQTVTSNAATLTVVQPDPCYAGDPVAQSSVGPINTWEYVTTYNPRGAFRLGYSESLMNSLWTSYCTYRVANPFTAQGVRNYRPDPRSTAAVADGDFSNTGYTRGHQVLMSDMELRYGGQAGTDTCFTTNLAPQIADHNNNLWNNLEQEVSGAYNVGTLTWTKPGLIAATNRMWITTGPLFTSNPVRRTPNGNTSKHMGLPDGFYKIMVKEVGGKPKALAILTPHEPTPAYSTIANYVTSIARIEGLSAVNLYPNLPGTAGEIATFKETVDVTGWGAPFEVTTKPNVHMVEPSWNISVVAGTTVTFVGAASSSTSTVSLPTWTFGAEGTASGYTTTHTFNTAGSIPVDFTVTDGNSITNTITRVITVTSGNAAPTIAAISPQNAVLTNSINVAFTVNDDTTPKNSLVVTATSSNQAVLLDGSIAVTPADATTGIGNLQLTGTGTIGSATVTVQVTDGDSAAATTTFAFNVTDGNAAPVISGLASKTTPVDTPITVDFTVSDTETAAGSLTVTAASSDTTLIPGTLTVANTAGACSLQLTPGTGLNGSATITITVTDGGGKSTQGTFGLTVGTPATPSLIISQYYEGASNDKWIELTNVGTANANLVGIYVAVLANANADAPDGKTPNQAELLTALLTGGQTTLAPGAVLLLKHASAVNPSYASGTASSAAGGFNGDDIFFLTTSADSTAWQNRTDVIGNGTSWGVDKSFYRNSTITVPNPVFTPSEWTETSNAAVGVAATGTTERLGEHIYTH